MENQKNKIYAGIGSRLTTPEVMAEMRTIAAILAENGYVLRSGGAEGADTAFEEGAKFGKTEIFVPWYNFNNREEGIVAGTRKKARVIAEEFHPYWHNLSQGGKKLHTRNVCQILGFDCDEPVDFVVCWTPDGEASGGTGQAIRIANHYGIKVYNLKKDTFPLDSFL